MLVTQTEGGMHFPQLRRSKVQHTRIWQVTQVACSCLPLLVHLPLVERQLFSLEDVAIKTAGLTWAGGDAGKQLVGVELIGHLLLQLAGGLSILELLLQVLGALGRADR